MEFSYRTRGTCSSNITFDLTDNIVTNVAFMGGCNGNLQAVAKLVEGLTVEEIEDKLKGILCGFKNTSCADQLATAVLMAKEKMENEKE